MAALTITVLPTGVFKTFNDEVEEVYSIEVTGDRALSQSFTITELREWEERHYQDMRSLQHAVNRDTLDKKDTRLAQQKIRAARIRRLLTAIVPEMMEGGRLA